MATPVEVSELCERLGWRGTLGYERLQKTPFQTVKAWLVIAAAEKEREAKRAG